MCKVLPSHESPGHFGFTSSPVLVLVLPLVLHKDPEFVFLSISVSGISVNFSTSQWEKSNNV